MTTDDDKTRIPPDVTKAGVGTQLSGIYELDERIASGGMGEVYLGHNIQTGDPVAIKIVLPEFARDQTILSLFRKEASILNHLSHDAIVRYHVFTIDPKIGRPYLAMEFVNGESLFDVMRRGAMASGDVGRLCYRLASGLSAVHAAGAVHRDLSPDNVILPEGQVERAKIIDFGIARSGAAGGETLIGGKFAGKYNYVSPEQLGLYGGEVSGLSDIYSLGLVLAAALRGRPLDMSGSQMEVVEKRRALPDLSDIDDDFRPIIEAMLQSNPQDRPTASQIAKMTRAQIPAEETTLSSRSVFPRDHSTMQPRTQQPSYPWAETPAAASSGRSGSIPPRRGDEARFIPHVSPARAQKPRLTAAPASTEAPARRPVRIRNFALASLAGLIVLAGVGGYLGGILSFQPPQEPGTAPRLSADHTVPPAAEETTPASRVVENSAPPPPTDNPPEPADKIHPASGSGEKIAATSEGKPAQVGRQEVMAAPSVSEPEAAASANAPDSQPGKGAQPGTTAETQPPAAMPRPAKEPARAGAGDMQPVTAESPPKGEASKSLPDGPGGTSSETGHSAKAVAPSAETPPPLSNTPEQAVQPETARPPEPQARPAPGGRTTASPTPEPTARDPNKSTTTPPAKSETPASTLQQTDAAQAENESAGQQPDGGNNGADLALNLPNLPEAPAIDTIDEVAARVSWLRDYAGGDCFYATATSATDKAIDIEGFGTAVEPFMQLLDAFKTKFKIEPEISVRLIKPAQCEVTQFLNALGAMAPQKPKLALDRTSVPSGSPVSGTLETLGGLRSSLFLIDHKGMAFNLEDRVVVEGGKATFNIPIGLGAADRAANTPVPQLIVAVTGESDIDAASFSEPIPAATLLPKILDEIATKRRAFSATAKYFQLGG
ncbi:protein kinase domain-containing protein [Mesorhizobium sp. 1B3]|uniref:serine/threonine-protein kinase n=1 Tax=Mesorhizobium sp. 1B3 TaxID=3243599 RepID=UPI003D972F3D